MDQYAEETLRHLIAQVCQVLGWNAIQNSALEVLVDLLRRYILKLGNLTYDYTLLSNRTDPCLNDLACALSAIRINLYELQDFVDHVEMPAYPVDFLPIQNSVVNIKFDHMNSPFEIQQRPPYIMPHLPALRDPQKDDKEDDTESGLGEELVDMDLHSSIPKEGTQGLRAAPPTPKFGDVLEETSPGYGSDFEPSSYDAFSKQLLEGDLDLSGDDETLDEESFQYTMNETKMETIQSNYSVSIEQVSHSEQFSQQSEIVREEIIFSPNQSEGNVSEQEVVLEVPIPGELSLDEMAGCTDAPETLLVQTSNSGPHHLLEEHIIHGDYYQSSGGSSESELEENDKLEVILPSTLSPSVISVDEPEENTSMNQRCISQQPTSTSTPRIASLNDFSCTSRSSDLQEDLLNIQTKDMPISEYEPTIDPLLDNSAVQVDHTPVMNLEDVSADIMVSEINTDNDIINETPLNITNSETSIIDQSDNEKIEQETLKLIKEPIIVFPKLEIGVLNLDSNKTISKLPLKKRTIQREISEQVEPPIKLTRKHSTTTDKSSKNLSTPLVPSPTNLFPVSISLSQIQFPLNQSLCPNIRIPKLSLQDKDKQDLYHSRAVAEKPRHKIIVSKNLHKQRKSSSIPEPIIVKLPLQYLSLNSLNSLPDPMIINADILFSSPKHSYTDEQSEVFLLENDSSNDVLNTPEVSKTSKQLSPKKRKSTSSKNAYKKSWSLVRIPLSSLSTPPQQTTNTRKLTVETSMVSEVSSIEGVDVSYGNDSNYLCPLCEEGYNGNLMIACEGNCQDLWFHGYCVNIDKVPNGEWLCPKCEKKKNKKYTKNRKHKHSEREEDSASTSTSGIGHIDSSEN